MTRGRAASWMWIHQDVQLALPWLNLFVFLPPSHWKEEEKNKQNNHHEIQKQLRNVNDQSWRTRTGTRDKGRKGGALLFAQSFGQNGRQEIAKTRVRWAAASAGIEQAASRGSPGHILVQGHFGRGLKAGLTGPCLAFAPILGRIPVAIDRIGRVARCRSHPSIVNIQQQIDWTTQLIGYAEPTCPATFGRTRRRACHFGPSFSQRFRDRYVLRLFGCIRQTGRFGSHFFPTQAKTHTHTHTR